MPDSAGTRSAGRLHPSNRASALLVLLLVAAFLGAAAVIDGTSGAASATKPQCNNRIDDDGDGKIDYPADPGCTRNVDKSEVDPVPPPPPPPPPSPADVVIDQKSDCVPGWFNGQYATEITTPYGPGFKIYAPAGGATAPWDSTTKAVLGKWAYPSNFLGKTYDWTFKMMLPAAGNPQGFPGGMLFEVGHTNTYSGHHFSIDNYPEGPRLRIGRWTGVPGPIANDYDVTYAPGVIQLDHWYTLRMQLKWSTGGDGFFKAWVDGVLMEDYTGYTIESGTGAAMHFGFYSENRLTNEVQFSTLQAHVTP
jgi:hypothetical protein